MEDILDEEVFEDVGISDDGGDVEEAENGPTETNQDQNDDNKDDESKTAVKPKRIIRNPRVTLNVERLRGPKGLGALEECFASVKYKGKGHEEEDLNTLLKAYGHWCHRLFPKFPFQDCIEKIEKLGTKGLIVTHLRKVRSGLIDEELPLAGDALPDIRSDDEDQTPNESLSVSQTIIDDIPIELTEEQLETIRRNREKAEQLRQERLRKIQEKAALNMPESNVNIGASTSGVMNGIEENRREGTKEKAALSMLEYDVNIGASTSGVMKSVEKNTNNISNRLQEHKSYSSDDSDEEILSRSKGGIRKFVEDNSDNESLNIDDDCEESLEVQELNKDLAGNKEKSHIESSNLRNDPQKTKENTVNSDKIEDALEKQVMNCEEPGRQNLEAPVRESEERTEINVDEMIVDDAGETPTEENMDVDSFD